MLETNVKEVEQDVVEDQIDGTTTDNTNAEVDEFNDSTHLKEGSEIELEEIQSVMENAKEWSELLKSQYHRLISTFSLTEEHVRKLVEYNETHKVSEEEWIAFHADKEEIPKYDFFNGLDSITHEYVSGITGPDALILSGVDYDSEDLPEEFRSTLDEFGCSLDQLDTTGVLVDRCKDVCGALQSLLQSLVEFRQIHDSYTELLEIRELKNFKQFELRYEQMEDGPEKEKCGESIKRYWYDKHVEFLVDESDDTVDRIAKMRNDKSKIEYLMPRAAEKLPKIGFDDKFLYWASNIERDFLGEGYEDLNQILLTYYISTAAHANVDVVTNENRRKIVCLTMAIDQLRRDIMVPEVREKVLSHIRLFVDKFKGKVTAEHAYSRKD